ncbi:MAG: D-aminoacylase [Moorella humiferrea]|nr:D-aminoacylase [Moorella humiferrea]
MFSLLIKNGLVVDGTGRPAFRADVGIQGTKITAVGALDKTPAARVINADGLAVAPGFIDIHSHADAELLRYPEDPAKVSQGVTCEVIGNCGMSLVPSHRGSLPLLASYAAPVLGKIPDTFCPGRLEEYLSCLAFRGTAVNYVILVGHGTIRLAVMGMEPRRAKKAELDAMASFLRQAMAEGAAGLSSGLLYPPGCYASTGELIALCRVIQPFSGIYVTHIRDESDGVLEAIEESLEIGREAGIPVHISHLKACGPRNWPKISKALAMLVEAREKGQDVTWDVYPYTTGSTTASSLLPPWAVAGGEGEIKNRLRNPEMRRQIKINWQEGLPGWDNMVGSLGYEGLIISAVGGRKNADCVGLNLVEIGDRRQCHPADALLDLLLEEGASLTIATKHGCEETLEMILKHPQTTVGSDGIYSGERPHPRLYGTFVRVLGRYVRERRLFTLEEAVAKMTSRPASRFGLKERGQVRVGYYADLVIFDPETVGDRATFEKPAQPPSGIVAVIVNGRVIYQDGQFSGELPGFILKTKPGQSPVKL